MIFLAEDTEPCQSSLAPYPTPQPPTVDGEIPLDTTLVPPATESVNDEPTTESINGEATTGKVWEVRALRAYQCGSSKCLLQYMCSIGIFFCHVGALFVLMGQKYRMLSHRTISQNNLILRNTTESMHLQDNAFV